ncbi:interferon-induced protein 44-like [Ruditapes philippinarum]|uniref:interferon-induced protein 44-like n=1 Tax=Ruditapes philippinarum TaxID=129788 RepID=UPI00295A6926|nr:interferon-induced protein 44-like [Ruditapes philippinarum]
MGIAQGTQAASSSSSRTPNNLSAPTLTKSPWRKTQFTYQNLVDEIISIKPQCPANVLLLGPTGAGKSSFINSILTTAKGRRVNKAYTGNKETSFTTTYERYMDEGIVQHCCLWDSMGIEHVLEGGLLLDDLVYLLKGHIKRGYKFNPRSKISETDPFFRTKPRIEDQIHCVVFVLDAGMVDEAIMKPYMSKIASLQERAHSLNIPCNLILTKIDELCQEVREDAEKTFWSVKVHYAVISAANMFGIPEGNIHPVRNYEVDIEIDDAASTHILIALRQIMYFASDKIEELKKNEERGCIVS